MAVLQLSVPWAQGRCFVFQHEKRSIGHRLRSCERQRGSRFGAASRPRWPLAWLGRPGSLAHFQGLGLGMMSFRVGCNAKTSVWGGPQNPTICARLFQGVGKVANEERRLTLHRWATRMASRMACNNGTTTADTSASFGIDPHRLHLAAAYLCSVVPGGEVGYEAVQRVEEELTWDDNQFTRSEYACTRSRAHSVPARQQHSDSPFQPKGSFSP